MMKEATALDILGLVHPRRDAWICLVLIPRIASKHEFAYIPNFKEILQDPIESKNKQLRWRSNVPYHIWFKRRDLEKFDENGTRLAKRLLGQLRLVNEKGWDVYYSLSAYMDRTENRKASNVSSLGTIYLDFDEPTEASEAFVNGQPYLNVPPPHAIVKTSPGKCQCLWQLNRVYAETRKVTETIRRLADLTGADTNATDIARIFRLPGYYNNKHGLRKYLVTAAWEPVQANRTKVTLEDLNLNQELSPLDIWPEFEP